MTALVSRSLVCRSLVWAACVLLVSACATRGGPVWPHASAAAARAAAGVELTLEPAAAEANVPAHVLEAVRAIAAAAGEDAVTITSAARTPRRQVELMIEYYVECPDNPDCSIDYMLAAYQPECLGDMAALYRPLAGASPEAVEATLAAMTREVDAAITALDAAHAAGAGPARTCMGHVAAPGKYAVDVAPSSVADWRAFYRAARALGDGVLVQERFYYPPIEGVAPSSTPDAAFHIEVRDPPDGKARRADAASS